MKDFKVGMGRGIAFTAVAALLWASPVRAADDNQERSLGTVVVTATRVEQPIEQATRSIAVITSDQIQSQHADAVTDVLREVPGLTVTQLGSSGSSASVFIRGADADQTLMLIDGVEMNSPSLGEFNFGDLTTDNVGRIEVLRGAGGTLYGSEAVGGVINVITKRGEGAPRVSVSSEGGNGDTQAHRLSVAGAKGPVGFSGSVGYQSTGGFHPVNDDNSNLTSSLRVDADLVDHGTLRGFFRYSDSTLGLFNNLNYLTPFTPDPNARFSEERYLFKGEWEHRPVEALTYRLAGWVMHDTQIFTDPDAGAFSTRRSDIPSQIASGEGQVTYLEGAAGVTTAGFEFKEKEARSKSIDLAADSSPTQTEFSASRSIYAGYMQQQLLLLDERLIGTGGFRVDSDEDFGREVSASWSVAYDFREIGLRVKGGYSEGFKAPTFNELFFPNFGNPNLDAETSSEYDGGVEQRLFDGMITVDATYFNRRTSNLIQGVPDPNNAPFGIKAENVGRVDVDGVETGVTLHPCADLTLRGSYTYLGFDVFGGSSTLLRRPHNQMGTTLRYRREGVLQGGDEIDLTSDINFVGDRSDVVPTTFQVGRNPAYAVTNAAATYSFPVSTSWLERVAFYTRIGNLFDRDYQEALGYDARPINFVVGTKLTF